jgi:hypothetical protein
MTDRVGVLVSDRPQDIESGRHESGPCPPRLSNATVTALAPRLLDLHAAAVYLGVSYWTMRDMVQNGTVPVVRLTATRMDTKPRRNGKPTQRVVLKAGDPRLGNFRRILVDRDDLDALVDRSKERTA